MRGRSEIAGEFALQANLCYNKSVEMLSLSDAYNILRRELYLSERQAMNTVSPSIQNDNRLDNTRRYRKTPKGLLTNLYYKMIVRSKEHHFPPPSFSKEELHKRFLSDDTFMHLFTVWLDAQDTWLKPSIDRIDARKPYTMDNIQVLTWRENKEKGYGERILWSKPIKQLDMDGNLIAIYPSAKAAIEVIGVYQGNLSKALHGKINHTGGYKWEFVE